ncbi:MAG: hypothetical protein N4A33_09975 [Bacteriovoracaceae bacterium]|jgi:Flp pilus assembly pilin Flp|nr:hypothetical protein [Bacteriovoracaceae bacterium]
MTFLNSNKGQAMVEYLLIMVFAASISIKMIQSFSDFMKTSMGSMGHILTQHLTTGVCEKNCFFAGYKNGAGS